ncbi:CopD family protein [Sinisalibacter aestuarii]|uniref:Copper resistance protein D domain-containing protein n=1 Tax=Sinisalibacter aestuarii TaxID=2949426 RepID=A0ABQ5LTX1_9RHOB|nr:CopD family protein [Sinisalibacter aestuarii]GKY88403.1 hypothetical protein STA1M1_22720 [Sinisalibacter aestuarii]
MDYSVLVIHLLGAAVWTGGHLVLALTVLPRALRLRDPEILREFEQGFERIGIPALLVQVASGVWLAWRYSPDPIAWITLADPVSAGIGLKLGLLVLTALFAVNARFRVIPQLSAETLPLMALHIRAVTLFSVLFVATGAYLSRGGF